MKEDAGGPLLRLEDEFISAAEELQTLHVLNEKEKVKGHDVNVRRLRRKLLLRKIKRSKHIHIFDLDASVLSSIPSLHTLKLRPSEPTKVLSIPYEDSFAATLFGLPFLSTSLTAAEPRSSPYTGRVLKPFIWKDYTSQPPGMMILGEIRNLYGNESEEPYNSIDYCHLQFWHLDQVNDLLWRVFWPGIDVAENLMYPDYSIVAIYRRLVVGCAFMTPEGYIPYVAVRPGWGSHGIARFMLYYLIQSLPSRDITLHVSADNPAMMLYQQFGFKPEEFVVNFYDKYLPPDSRHCKNAFFVRLRR
ncbi:hypothetical protein SeMB42_g06451 [Synchytrium endobioticum]|uniref:N-acetyltransferase domain-containing protein n=1 Tax=Synchytrium endobioticum TaxID=286115 RepID=A0A507CBE5_9FUNG|nr:hypothetical protein SeLEV6574_g07536 [Synchytrium endobioticum]TPX39125.1 hypothetical protein SeMB42_g06451 [Synchytrium endobioticum]